MNAHAGSQSNRVVCQDAHQDGSEAGRYGSCHKHCVRVHTGVTQYGRVYAQNVSHCQEGCDTGDDFCPDVCFFVAEFEQLFEHC